MRDHCDGARNAFDGFNSVLTHTWGPNNGENNISGDDYLDGDEIWTLDCLSKVSLHEFGHTLGLHHSAFTTAVRRASKRASGRLPTPSNCPTKNQP